MKTSIMFKDSAGNPTWLVPVANPNGVIKYVRCSGLVQSAIVEPVGEGRGEDREFRLKGDLPKLGWALLCDLFKEDNMSVAWDRYREWMRQSSMVTPGGEVKRWPEKYLPSGILERRNNTATHLAEPEEVSIPELDNRSTSRKAREKAGL
ncbi:hypothetical protein [Nannocystis pusilla]|uniref:hypothetical protein n=1 Tax=Nannocystis pusilla TaxID=889268 RepID=UPI003DA23A53